MRFYHGGVPGLNPGDVIEPGFERRPVEGCAICKARAAGKTYVVDGQPIDPPTVHDDRIYVTTERLYALFHASLYGRGDLYVVDPVGEMERSTEDTIESYICERAVVRTVYRRCVLLTNAERRRVYRRWEVADMQAGHGAR
jgi:hypothetical protein